VANSNPFWWGWVTNCYANLAWPHRCKIIIITDYLSDEQMEQLTRASAYYVTTTRAEGYCLPVMNFLAAGRPVVSPCHSAISDYFDEQVGFVLESHPEPTAFPQDPHLQFRTMWHRLVWPSLVDQLKASYRMAKHGRTDYEALAARGRERMRAWAGEDVVFPSLQSALSVVLPGQSALRAAS
jgi:hypothetical protein